MSTILDILLFVACITAGLYCYILSRKLTRFCDLENGIGGAVAVLAVQVDDLQKTLDAAQKTSSATSEELGRLNKEALESAEKLEALLTHSQPENSVIANRRVSRKRKVLENVL